MVRPVKVDLYAPVEVSGGIASWARTFIDQVSDEFVIEVVDTAQRYLDLGSKRPLRRLIFGGRDAVSRLRTARARARATPRPDVAYLTCAPSLGFWLRDLPILYLYHHYRIPSVVHLHGGSAAGFLGAGVPFLGNIVGRALRRAGGVISITTEMHERVTTMVGRDKAFYMPNMMTRKYLAAAGGTAEPPRGSRPIVLHVGWQSIEKGTLTVLGVAAAMPEVDFLLVGNIPDDFEPRIAKRMSELGNPPNVNFLGVRSRDELVVLFAAASVFLFPTRFSGEGFPMVVLEAMSHGLPVVATKVGEIPVMLGVGDAEPAGYILDPDTPTLVEDIARLVKDLLANLDLRERLGSAGRGRVETQYAADIIVPRIEALMAQIVVSDKTR